MSSNAICNNIKDIEKQISKNIHLVAVSKTKPNEDILTAYNCGHRDFGENKVQEMTAKYESLPKDIRWHLIGHLQRNKVKYIASFVYLIHSVDNLKLLKEINKQATKHNRVISVLLQIKIAKEETKFGMSFQQAEELINSDELKEQKNVKISGLMGMATNTNDKQVVAQEFQSLKNFYKKLQKTNPDFQYLSMGMSGDYKIAIQNGSNMIRVGSVIFGARG